MESSRRDFFRCTGRLTSLAMVGGVLTLIVEGCATPTSPGNEPTLPIAAATVSGRSLLLTIDASSPLATVGTAALVQSTLGSYLITRTGQSTFTALSAICTHQACTVSEFANQMFVCPCHGSEFDVNGKIVAGPATAPLAQFGTAFVGTVLTVTT